jgi:hypothetical protein
LAVSSPDRQAEDVGEGGVDRLAGEPDEQVAYFVARQRDQVLAVGSARRGGAGAAAEAEKLRTRLLHEVDERRSTKLRASVNELLDC